MSILTAAFPFRGFDLPHSRVRGATGSRRIGREWLKVGDSTAKLGKGRRDVAKIRSFLGAANPNQAYRPATPLRNGGYACDENARSDENLQQIVRDTGLSNSHRHQCSHETRQFTAAKALHLELRQPAVQAGAPSKPSPLTLSLNLLQAFGAAPPYRVARTVGISVPHAYAYQVQCGFSSSTHSTQLPTHHLIPPPTVLDSRSPALPAPRDTCPESHGTISDLQAKAEVPCSLR